MSATSAVLKLGHIHSFVFTALFHVSLDLPQHNTLFLVLGRHSTLPSPSPPCFLCVVYPEMRLTRVWSALALLAPLAVEASVLAIDYGADYMKASLMKPGTPFDVLLNKDSKRKVQSVVGWKKSDRIFGGDAFNLVCLLSVFFLVMLN